jgi:hypothetical protein
VFIGIGIGIAVGAMWGARRLIDRALRKTIL